MAKIKNCVILLREMILIRNIQCQCRNRLKKKNISVKLNREVELIKIINWLWEELCYLDTRFLTLYIIECVDIGFEEREQV
jgi:hypothetical protein